MAKKQPTRTMLSSEPPVLTALGPRHADGRCRSAIDNSVWLYGRVPLVPGMDAVNDDKRTDMFAQTGDLLQELTSLASVGLANRYLARSSYREVHLLLINTPAYYHVPWDHPQSERLNAQYGDRTVDRRVLLVGVRLRDKTGGGGSLSDIIASTAALLVDQQIPMEDFEPDYKRVKRIFDRKGIAPPSRDNFDLANAYWNQGKSPSTPILPHLEHVHVFRDTKAMRQVELIGPGNCELMEAIPGQNALTFGSVASFDFDFNSAGGGTTAGAPAAPWATHLLDAGALVVSIRGLLEPTKVTRRQIRSQRGRYEKDLRERAQQGKMSRDEQEEKKRVLDQVERFYSSKDADASPTLIDASVLVGFDGVVDVADVDVDTVALEPMTVLQPQAMAETWLCSSVRANPRRHELPVHVLAAGGLNNLSFVGDREGAVLGQTERDSQMALVSSTAASFGDGLPFLVGYASTGSGKSLMGLNLCKQWVEDGGSGVFGDLKEESDHADYVEHIGGTVRRLDEITQADGVFDPIRFLDNGDDVGRASKAKGTGQAIAKANLITMNPWGGDTSRFEAPLARALQYGCENGATCTGEALTMAANDLPDLPEGMVDGVFTARDTDPLIAAQIGIDRTAESLVVDKGLTLVMLGQQVLDMPSPGDPTVGLSQRASKTLLRMMSYGSARAVARLGGGFVTLDEAHIFLQDPTELIRLGRTMRILNTMLFLLTQKPSDVLENRIQSFISRTLIGPLDADENEAAAACKAHGLDPDKFLPRLSARSTKKADDQSLAEPNWESMKTLRGPVTAEHPRGDVLRGTVWLYQDFSGDPVPVEASYDDDFLFWASTNPADVEHRRAILEQERPGSGSRVLQGVDHG